METAVTESEVKAEDLKRLMVSGRAYESFEKVKAQLRERGVKEFTFQRYLDGLLDKTPEKTMEDIIEENTPDEYRISEALRDPAMKKRILNEIKKAKVK